MSSLHLSAPDRLRSRVENLPLALSTRAPPVPLTLAEAPSLEDLKVTVPRLAPITSDELMARLQALRRRQAQARDRQPGDPVAIGDDVLINLIGYAGGGAVLPFSVRDHLWMELVPEPLMPGFCEALAGRAVGERLEVKMSFPADYPFEALRGLEATFAVELLAARALTLPAADDPRFIASLGRGADLDEVMQSLVTEVDEERSEQTWELAQGMVLEEIARRVTAPVPPELVAWEVENRWSSVEGAALAARGLGPDEQRRSLDGWLKDEVIWREAERRVKVSAALQAICQRDQVVLTQETLKEIVFNALEGLAEESELDDYLANEPSAAQLGALAQTVLAVNYVMARAEVDFEEEEPDST